MLEEVSTDYQLGQDRPGTNGTSRLSPALRWGHVSPVQIWEALGRLAAEKQGAADGARAIMRQLAWRNFCWNLRYHHPDMGTVNLRPEFNNFDCARPTVLLPTPNSIAGAAKPQPGSAAPEQAEVDAFNGAWCRGETGFRWSMPA
ncbi:MULTISPECIES: FAD-binding domain-containing protein [Arthrobacter]|uniref:FAD-binding domain-containing protein n=1 Tax=Arthrobacter TaxID=1663 RepID=UPI001C94E644